jgi:hypothetical protein
MIEDDEDMEWNKTNVFIHLRRQFKVSSLGIVTMEMFPHC